MQQKSERKPVVTEERLLADIEAERHILASLLALPHSMIRVVDRLAPEHFYSETYREVYEIMLGLYERKRLPTPSSVYYVLKTTNNPLMSQDDLLALSQEHSLFGDVVDHAEQVISRANYRQLWYAANEIGQMAMRGDEDAIERSVALLDRIATRVNQPKVPSFAEACDAFLEELHQRMEDRQQGIAHGLHTGYREIDRMIGGLQPGDMITIAALTGLGKTAFAINIAMNVASRAKHCMFFSLEMKRNKLLQRIFARVSLVDQTRLRDGDLDEACFRAIQARMQGLKKCRMEIDDSATLLGDICAEIRKRHHEDPLDLVVIDYIQLVELRAGGRANGMNRTEELAQISRTLKLLAHQLNIPIMVLAQVNRKVEERQMPEPKLSDLNESGSMARDSSVVLFIFAEETEEVQGARKSGDSFPVFVKVAKSREGVIGTVPLTFTGKFSEFTETEDLIEAALYGNREELR